MGVSRILEGIVAAVVLVSFVAARPAPVQVYGCGPSGEVEHLSHGNVH